MASLQPLKLSASKVNSLCLLIPAFNLHWWTKLMIKFATTVNLTWFTAVDCSFSCIQTVLVQLHSKLLTLYPVTHLQNLCYYSFCLGVVRHSSNYLFWCLCERSNWKSEEWRAAVFTAGCIVAGSVFGGVQCAVKSSPIMLRAWGVRPGTRHHWPAWFSFEKWLGRALTSLQDLLGM